MQTLAGGHELLGSWLNSEQRKRVPRPAGVGMEVGQNRRAVTQGEGLGRRDVGWWGWESQNWEPLGVGDKTGGFRCHAVTPERRDYHHHAGGEIEIVADLFCVERWSSLGRWRQPPAWLPTREQGTARPRDARLGT